MPATVIYRDPYDDENLQHATTERVLLSDSWVFIVDANDLVPHRRVVTIEPGNGVVDGLVLPIGDTDTDTDSGGMGTGQLGGGKLGGGD